MKQLLLALASIFLWASDAHAATECKISGAKNVYARWENVTIDGQIYTRDLLQNQLVACNYGAALGALDRWETNHWVSLGTGLGGLLIWPALLVTPFTGANAVKNRNQLEIYITQGQ